MKAYIVSEIRTESKIVLRSYDLMPIIKEGRK